MIFEEIVAGWKNYVFPNPQVEEEAKRRLKICLDKSICKKLSNRNYCTICRCYMPAKVRSPKSKCPLRKW
jgi:hypothetical protein